MTAEDVKKQLLEGLNEDLRGEFGGRVRYDHCGRLESPR
jgi:hypothetical protein